MRNICIKLFAYSILVITLFLATFSPVYLQLVGGYAAPTATYAHMLISKTGVPKETDYWSYVLMAEIEYPAPSIFLNIYCEILGLPLNLRMFQPAMGLASLVFFVFALKIMTLGGIRREYALLLSAMYYLFIVTDQLIAHYVGRATFGVDLLVYFLIALLVHINCRKREGLIPLLLITALLGFTYYTSTLAVFLISIFSYPLIKLISPNEHKHFKHYKELYVLSLLTIALVIIRSISTPTLLASTSPANFYYNLIEYLKAQLKIEKASEAYYLLVGFSGEIDPIIRITQIWLRTTVKLIAALTLLILFSRGIIKSLRRKGGIEATRLSEYIVIAFVCSLSELAYTFIAPTFSFRFLNMFGLPVFILSTYSRATLKTTSRSAWNSARKAILATTLGLLLIIGATSIIMLQHGEVGHAKLYGYEKVQGLITYFTVGNPLHRIVIVTDAYYSAVLYYLLKISNSNVVVEPFGLTSIPLYYACENDSLYYDDLIHQLGSRQLLLVENETIFGDPWGYAIRTRGCELVFMFNLMYSDSRFTLLVR
ncbi:MAG: hypothetical protein QXZ17_08925 [Nitrososphaerota archaeon]